AEFQTRTGTRPVLEWAGELPLAKLRLEARVEQTIEELAAVLQPPEFTSDILNSLRAAWTPGRGFACAFATWIETLLGPYGLVVFESADPAAKPLVACVFARALGAKPLRADVFAGELSSPGRTAALAAEASEALAARGHAPQVVSQPDSVALLNLHPVRPAIRCHG